jgi:hypothetical protein
LWCGGVHLHRECPEKTNTESTPSCHRCILEEKGETSSSVISRLPPRERRTTKKSTTSSQGILWQDVLLSVHLTRAVLNIYTVSRHATSATTGTADRWEKLSDPRTAAPATTGNSENRCVSTDSQFD